MTGGVPPRLGYFESFVVQSVSPVPLMKSGSPPAVHRASPLPCAPAIRPDFRIVSFRSGSLGPPFPLRRILLSEIFPYYPLFFSSTFPAFGPPWSDPAVMKAAATKLKVAHQAPLNRRQNRLIPRPASHRPECPQAAGSREHQTSASRQESPLRPYVHHGPWARGATSKLRPPVERSGGAGNHHRPNHHRNSPHQPGEVSTRALAERP